MPAILFVAAPLASTCLPMGLALFVCAVMCVIALGFSPRSIELSCQDIHWAEALDNELEFTVNPFEDAVVAIWGDAQFILPLSVAALPLVNNVVEFPIIPELTRDNRGRFVRWSCDWDAVLAA